MSAILLHLLPASLYAGLGVFFWRTCMARGSALQPRRECMSTRERLLLLGAIVAHGAALHLAIFPGSEMRFGFGVALSLMVWLAVCFYWVETLYTRLVDEMIPKETASEKSAAEGWKARGKRLLNWVNNKEEDEQQ